MVRALGVHLLVYSTYLVLAFTFTRPLGANYDTHLLGAPGGDAGVYVWNLWAFRQELIEHRHWPFRTELLFVPNPDGVGLALHNYTVFANLLALPLQRAAGLIPTFNLVYWLISAGNAYGMFLLARHLTRDTAAAFLAGAAFGFTPFLITRAIEHLSLATALALPVFLLLLLKAVESGAWRQVVGAGLALAWAVLSDPYYAVFAILMGAYVLLVSAVDVTRGRPRPRAPRGDPHAYRGPSFLLDLLIGLLAVQIVVSALMGEGGVRLLKRVVVSNYYTPMLVLVLLVLLRVWLATRPRLHWKPGVDLRRAAPRLAIGVAALVVACLPVMHALAQSFTSGQYVQPDVHWRSSPPGVDFLAFLLPNPNRWSWPWLATRPNGFVENVASLSLVALGVVAWAAVAAREALPRFWIGFTALFTLLALGPFVHVAGLNTHIPTPWSLLRFVPVVANARSPSRFAVVVALGVAVLFAFALRAAFARFGRRPALAALVGLALLYELKPGERKLHAAGTPSIYTTIAADPRPVSVLVLPFGVRSGASNVGDFSAFSMFGQTVHGKPMLGGYLSRVSDKHVQAYRQNAMADALLRLSSGETLTPEAAQAARDARREFLHQTQLGYVVIDKRKWPDKAHRFVVLALRLEEAGADGPFDLYAVPQ